jgi:REP element-mobilizing transposase RayT
MPIMRALPGMRNARHVWYREYRDRYIRDQDHFQAVVAYIHNNPAKAGLCRTPETWLWSSARLYHDD